MNKIYSYHSKLQDVSNIHPSPGGPNGKQVLVYQSAAWAIGTFTE